MEFDASSYWNNLAWLESMGIHSTFKTPATRVALERRWLFEPAAYYISASGSHWVPCG